MSWYETTAFESISLCRSLLDKESLRAFDRVLLATGLGKLCRNDVMEPTQINRDEVLAELKWLKTLLINVEKRANQFGIPLAKRKHENGTHQLSNLSSQSTGSSSTKAFAKNASAGTASTLESTSWRDRFKKRKTAQKPKPKEKARKENVRKPPQKKVAHKATQKPKKPVEIWCVCRGGSSGLMIACDNEKCPYEWFHTKCVGLQREPSGTWYCPLCKPRFERPLRAQSRKR